MFYDFTISMYKIRDVSGLSNLIGSSPGDFIFYAHFKMADCHGSVDIRKAIP